MAGLASLDFFFVVGGVESVVASGFFVALAAVVGCGSVEGSVVVFVDDVVVDSSVEPVVDELVDDDSDPDESVVSANATPWPLTTAAPMPNATASPPIRPMYAPAPMGEIHTVSS
jgi:hypothetical protein